MERVGLSKVRPVDGAEYDIFGMHTIFREIATNAVKGTVKGGKWFAFGKRISDKQVDIATIKNNKGESIGSFMASDYSESMYRVGVYKYLLRDFLCYYEAPTVVRMRDQAGVRESYSKSLVTSNLYVIAEWLGISYEEADAKYGMRLGRVELDDDIELFQYVKLSVDKTGARKVTNPRKDLDLSVAGTRVVPVFALKAGVDMLFEMASEDFYTVDFVKDSGSPRSINICFDISKLRTVYTDEGPLLDMYESQYKGEFLELKTMERGYIRVIEVGTNIKSNPLRSINFARITEIRREDPDLTFLNIDLDTVHDTFLDGINAKGVNIEEVVASLEMFQLGKDRKYGGRDIKTVSDLEGWFEANTMLLSTPFTKSMALFMIACPQWFGGYDGQSKVSSSVAGDYSSAPIDVEIDDDDFDIM